MKKTNIVKLFALTAALLVAAVSVSGCTPTILAYTIADSTGVFGRLDNAAKSDNFRINENHMDVYRYHVAQNELYYQFMYIQYGLMEDPTGGYVSSGLFDVFTYMNWMIPNYVDSGSFDETAYEYAKQYLTYCEGAKAAGKYDALKADAAADIDEYIDNLKTMAEENQISFSKYLSGWIGKGVSENDVRQAMEYYYIGIAYASELYEKFSTQITAAEIEAYIIEHNSELNASTHEEKQTVARDAIASEKLNDWYKTNSAKYNVTVDYEIATTTNAAAQ